MRSQTSGPHFASLVLYLQQQGCSLIPGKVQAIGSGGTGSRPDFDMFLLCDIGKPFCFSKP